MQTKAQRKAWRERRLAAGICPRCGRPLETNSRRSCLVCRNKDEAKRRTAGCNPYNKKKRIAVIKAYGGKCTRCGFSDWRALQLDHVNGDGYKEKHKYYYGFLKRLIANPDFDRYQLLCANCNWIKRYENNENPNVAPAA